MTSRAEGKREVHDTVTMRDVEGEGWKIAPRHARHGEAWPGSRGW